MAKITKLGLKNVRCFADNQSGQLARITLLVGPNGSGKSTFLGCYNAFVREANLNRIDDSNYFNGDPFKMGGFQTIARTGCDSFSVEGQFADHCYKNLRFDFESTSDTKLREKCVCLDWQDNHLRISMRDSPRKSICFETPHFSLILDWAHISYSLISNWLSQAVKYGHLPFNGNVDQFKRQNVTRNEVINFSKFISFVRTELPLQTDPVFDAFASDPVQVTSRKRLYSVRPQLLENNDQEASVILSEFGASIGLWRDIQIKGNKHGYEIVVTTSAGTHNLQDVGYGIFSILPWARAFYDNSPDTVFLMEQPEVHLHPESQAKLAQLIVDNRRVCMIETHSDHFLDRLRICVMRGELDAEDLSILYLEPVDNGKKTVIHSIAVDDSGNLLNVPSGFRDFFIRETDLLLGFES